MGHLETIENYYRAWLGCDGMDFAHEGLQTCCSVERDKVQVGYPRNNVLYCLTNDKGV